MVLKKKSLLHSIFYMSGATVIAQLINIVSQPIIVRLVSPQTLGIYTFLVGTANIVIPIASLKLEMLLVSEKKEKIAQYLTDLCLILVCLVSFLFLLIIGIGYSCRLSVLTQYGLIIFCIPIIVFTNGIRFVFLNYNNRYKQYDVISKISIIRELARALIQVISGLIHIGVIGMIAGYVLAPLFCIKYQTKDFIQRLKNRAVISGNKIISLFKANKNQVAFLVPAQALNSFSFSLIIISISLIYSAEELGYYSVGIKLLEIPLVLITTSVCKVIFQKISSDVNNDKGILHMFSKTTMILTGISVLFFSVLYITGPYLAKLIFGNNYILAGFYTKCLCLMYALRFIATSFTGLFTLFNKQKIELYLMTILITTLIIIGSICKWMHLSITSYLWMVGCAFSITYVTIWILYYVLCKSHDKHIMIKSLT